MTREADSCHCSAWRGSFASVHFYKNIAGLVRDYCIYTQIEQPGILYEYAHTHVYTYAVTWTSGSIGGTGGGGKEAEARFHQWHRHGELMGRRHGFISGIGMGR